MQKITPTYDIFIKRRATIPKALKEKNAIKIKNHQVNKRPARHGELDRFPSVAGTFEPKAPFIGLGGTNRRQKKM